MKPILYAAALENGFNPLTFLSTEKTIFTYDEGRSTYEPKNVNGKFAGHPISLAQALAISDNIFAVKHLKKSAIRNSAKWLNVWASKAISQNLRNRARYIGSDTFRYDERL